MASKSYNNGFPLSSTPIPSLEDSGYFGSGLKRKLCISNAKVLGTCSPIKEFTFKHPKDACFAVSQKENAHDYENITKSEHSSNAEASELAGPDFYCSQELQIPKLQYLPNTSDIYCHNSSHDFSPHREKFDSFYSSSNGNDIRYNLFPSYQSEDFDVSNLEYSNSIPIYQETNYEKNSSPLKCSFNQTKINFIGELKNRNCMSIISTILSCLSPEELCKSSCASKDWNEAILQDRKARSRKEGFVEERALFLNGPSKENRLGMKCGPAREHKNAFCNLTNIVNVDLLSSKNSKSRFDSFISEAKDGHTKLFKCPKCSYASKLHSKNNCVCTQCSYKFCSECLSPIFKNHVCYKPELPKTFIGSKQSKKNLKRL